MKILLLVIALLSFAQVSPAQWIKQTVDTTASLRGLAVVNEKIVWASGTVGSVIKTIDGGKTWKVMTVPGAEKLDFRDIEAFDANTAYILSIGNGESSRIYKTNDGGNKWQEFFRNTDEKAFFDAIGCWGKQSCIAMSDPVDGTFLLRQLNFHSMGGSSGRLAAKIPPAKSGEAAFAASGTCLIAFGANKAFMVSGGNDARVFRTNNRGLSWDVADTAITKGSPGSGIFSIAMFDRSYGVVVGGNYEKPEEAKDNLAFTTDSGTTWKLGTGLSGYRSAVAYIDRNTIIAVGTNGTDLSKNGGKTWTKIGSEDLNAVAAKGKKAVWAVGPKGGVYKLK